MPQVDISDTSNRSHVIAPTLLGNYVEERQAFEAQLRARNGENPPAHYAHEDEGFHPRRHHKNRPEPATTEAASPKRVAATLLGNWVEERYAKEVPNALSNGKQSVIATASIIGTQSQVEEAKDAKMDSAAVWKPTPAVRGDPHFHIKHKPNVTLQGNWFEDRFLLEEAGSGRARETVIGMSGPGGHFDWPQRGVPAFESQPPRADPRGNHKAPQGKILLENFVEERAVADKGFKDPEDLPTLSKAGHQGILAQSDKRELITTNKAEFKGPAGGAGRIGRRLQLQQEEYARIAASEIKEPVEDRSAKDWISTAKQDFGHEDIYPPVEDLGSKPVDEAMKRQYAQPVTFWTDQAAMANGIAICSMPSNGLANAASFGKHADFSTPIREFKKGAHVQFTPIL
ncbi:hypothetical protein SmJEL517_g02654 [Synchytrium microbalum]|uniref:Uncharacterized protein n=1 Tax=Synchytrium microbalum TaxID=1806994 RepID=A0A507CBF2_9FUNG|nr:uncharacterized protein SmJEL517_g02654 [Synchytrium microbalum]TPX34873.1 hypothetical protein SmJEL517_g02654 [Synchytrium microbalum]